MVSGPFPIGKYSKFIFLQLKIECSKGTPFAFQPMESCSWKKIKLFKKKPSMIPRGSI